MTVLSGRSEDKLLNLKAASFDVIYVDGSHLAKDVLSDAILSWRLLKTGGILIMDDYGWRQNMPIDLRPKFAIDVFLKAYGGEIEVIHQDYQVIVRKKDYPCNQETCFVVGKFIYYPLNKRLFTSRDRVAVRLSESEIEILERHLNQREFSYLPVTGKPVEPEFAALAKRLEL